MNLFSPDDFRIFDISGFAERMAALRGTIRPKLESIGTALAPQLTMLVDAPVYAHVARHARRTVNAPDDTWAAFGRSRRGYKKDVHFKIAVSRHCVRVLFEVGPEYYAKPEWALAWTREFRDVRRQLAASKHLAWFQSEHDEDPVCGVDSLAPAALRKLSDNLTGRKDGQLVFGRRIAAADFVKLTSRQFCLLAVTTWAPLAPLFSMGEPRGA